jgi:hypothetical protein
MNIMQDKGPNDLEAIIEKLKRENYKLKLEIEMLKKIWHFYEKNTRLDLWRRGIGEKK